MVHTLSHTHMYTHTHILTHTHSFTHTYTHIHPISNTQSSKHTHSLTLTHVHTHTYTAFHTLTCTRLHTHLLTHTHTHTHTHTLTYLCEMNMHTFVSTTRQHISFHYHQIFNIIFFYNIYITLVLGLDLKLQIIFATFSVQFHVSSILHYFIFIFSYYN